MFLYLYLLLSYAVLGFTELLPNSPLLDKSHEALAANLKNATNLTTTLNNTSTNNNSELISFQNQSLSTNESLSFNRTSTTNISSIEVLNETISQLNATYTVKLNSTYLNGSQELIRSLNTSSNASNISLHISEAFERGNTSENFTVLNITEFVNGKDSKSPVEPLNEPRRYDQVPLPLVEIMRNLSDFIHNKSMSEVMNERYKLKKQPDGKGCKEEHLMPCSFGIGRDCNLLLKPNGCFVCTCPYKSPARGCLGPSDISLHKVEKLLNKNNSCENGAYAQHADRYVRNVDINQKDDCVLTIQPYCGFINDVNTYRMPRTKEECYYNCFSDQELHDRDIKLNYKL